MSKLNPYAKLIAAVINGAVASLLGAQSDLPPWATVLLTTIVTLVSVYFPTNTPVPGAPLPPAPLPTGTTSATQPLATSWPDGPAGQTYTR